MGVLYDFWPRDVPSLHNQKTLSDITEEDFNATFAPVPVTPVQKWLRRISFVVFFGWLRMICFVLFTIVFIILAYPCALIYPYFPFARSIGVVIGKVYMRGLLWCYGLWWIKVKGKIDPQTRQISYNHTTIPDGLLMFYIHTSTFVMVAAAKKMPIFGKMMDVMGSIYIDRSHQGGSASLVSDGIRNHAIKPVAIAPEAKLSNGDVIFRFRTGGFLTAEQVQPIAFRYYRILPAFGGQLSWFVPSFLDYLKGVFCSPGFVLVATWLDPIRTDQLEGKTPQERADITQLALANFFGTLAISKSTKDFFQKTEEAPEGVEEKTKNE
jgi:1-acyl-sn-glycerol-3-phosphate acyltransferase